LVKTYDVGLLFKTQNADFLREAIIRFVNLKLAEIKTLKDNCHRFAGEFSMERWAQGCLGIYDKLLVQDAQRNLSVREVSSDGS
jgi:hypothetical protein